MAHKKNYTNNVIHVVPAMKIGGVEVGIFKSYNIINRYFKYEIINIRRISFLDIPSIGMSGLILKLFNNKTVPDVVVTSLWPSHMIGFTIGKLFGLKWIAFIHSANVYGPFKELFIKMAIKYSDYVLCDSESTKFSKCRNRKNDVSVCPYVFPRQHPVSNIISRQYDFIFVGRLSKVKRLDLVLKFIEEYNAVNSDSLSLFIIAGDKDEIETYRSQIHERNCGITVMNNVDPMDVGRYYNMSKFYILFSDAEGFSMSTVEAMQYGCIPVVRQVGELKNYLNDDFAIILKDDSIDSVCELVPRVKDLYNNDNLLSRYSEKSINAAGDLGSYVDSFIEVVTKCS
jgi:glycosyltransferase involved in cell wall biosynthesis